ncbi:endonuclease/exonuclease/phosphatase family protein [Treponema primitia]|uniref:hypothetical protein n=1 Tax=Treponema primitia TaxID=88058 RepID=UPI00397F8002
MKILSWNCHDHFTDAKSKKVTPEDPDILIIQECQKKEYEEQKKGWAYHCWYGDGLNGEPGGIAIFSKDGYRLERYPISEFGKKLRYVIPYKISGRKDFTLGVVWTKGKPFGYTETVLMAIDEYKMYDSTILIGDFNTRSKNNKDDNYLKLEKGMQYRNFFNCDIDETPAFTFYRGLKKVIDDYCFVSEDIKCQVKSKTGFHETWTPADYQKGTSDHCPLIVTVDL